MARYSDTHFKNAPFVRISVPFAAGITTDIIFQTDLKSWVLILFTASVIIISIRILPLKWKWKLNLFEGVCIVMMISSFGGVVHNIKTNITKNNFSIRGNVHCFKIEEPYKKTNNGKRYLAEIYTADEQPKYITNGYLYVKDSLTILNEGDVILSSAIIKRIKNTANPGAYDFSKESAKRGVYTKISISSNDDFFLIGREKRLISNWINHTQTWIIHTLQQKLKDKEKYGLAEAILIGHRDDMDSSLLSSYINTGVVHVIAISGLHIGLIFMIINMLVNKMSTPEKVKYISLFTTLPVIWWFTLLTGATPSVVRSALMTTIILVGKALSRKPNTLNSMMASAYIQTMVYPDIVNDLGFQLSYAAVGSILIFNPLISKMVFVKNPIIKECWGMVSITIAAQLLTTPISLYQFNQFPVLFLITNLVAVPLSSILLLAELLLCLTEFIHLKTDTLSFITNLIIDGMNGYIRKIEGIPFAIINDIFIGVPTLILMYLALYFLWKFLKHKTRNYFINLLLIVSVAYATNNIHGISSLKSRIAILNVPGGTCIMLQDGNIARLILNNSLLENHDKLTILKKQLAKKYWIERFEFSSIPSYPLMITLTPRVKLGENKQSISKIVVLTGTPRIELNTLLKHTDTAMLLIADASNKLWKIQQWQTEADRLLLRFYSVDEEGPLVMENSAYRFSVFKN